ncbi:MAG: hypothetical protein IJR66_04260 [Clostridia bacterium]|nr:hypothetical protein [Clostridia bacterium]
MKKVFVLITSLILSLIFFIFAGCGKAGPLDVFTNAFDKNNTVTIGYSEKNTYSVTYTNNYKFENFDYSADDSLNNIGIAFDNGVFTTELKVLKIADFTENKDSDILSSMSEDQKSSLYVFKYETTLSIDAIYSFDGNSETCSDYVYSVCYFLPINNQLAPLYSKTENKSAIISVSDSLHITKNHFVSIVSYNKDSYTMDKYAYDYDDTELTSPLSHTNNDGKVYAYNYNSLIDNASLLFAIRNLNIEKEKETTVPVVSPSYEKAVNLSIAYSSDFTEKDTIGNEYAVKLITFVNGESNVSGKKQLTFIDKDNAKLIKMVTPLSEYSIHFKSIGALVYTLSE